MSSIGKRVLLVDDDEQLVALLAMQLAKYGYAVTTATKPEQGYAAALQQDFDVIVLDVIMPRMTGIEICSKLRARGILTPIIILSGQIETEVIVQGLNAGADDYLTKPFHDTELIARIRARIRRQKKAFTTQQLQRNDLMLDLAACMIRHDDVAVALTRKETLLLKRLMAESPDPVARLVLLQDVWGIGSGHASNRLDVYILRLRKKLETLGYGDYINTVRSGGYYFGKAPLPGFSKARVHVKPVV